MITFTKVGSDKFQGYTVQTGIPRPFGPWEIWMDGRGLSLACQKKFGSHAVLPNRISTVLWPKKEDPKGSEAKKFHDSIVRKIKKGSFGPQPNLQAELKDLAKQVFGEIRRIDAIEN